MPGNLGAHGILGARIEYPSPCGNSGAHGNSGARRKPRCPRNPRCPDWVPLSLRKFRCPRNPRCPEQGTPLLALINKCKVLSLPFWCFVVPFLLTFGLLQKPVFYLPGDSPAGSGGGNSVASLSAGVERRYDGDPNGNRGGGPARPGARCVRGGVPLSF